MMRARAEQDRRSTGILPVGPPGVSPGEFCPQRDALFSPGETPGGPTGETPVLRK